MATTVNILTQKEIKTFDYPPEFTGEERKNFFELSTWAKDFVENLRTANGKVGFVIQYGYFKSVTKFFTSTRYHQQDIKFVARLLNTIEGELNLSSVERTIRGYQPYILNYFGFSKFESTYRYTLEQEALSLCSKQIKPKLIFLSLVDFLKTKKVEIPTYHTFAEVITNSLRTFEKNMISAIKQCLSSEDKILLDELLEFESEYVEGLKQNAKIKRYKLTILKRSNQIVRPSRIKENIDDLQCLEEIFQKIKPVIDNLDLSPELIQYYAHVVIKSQVFQIERREDRRYLLLIAFVAYQYYQLNDILIEILLKSVQAVLTTCEREYKENFYNRRIERHKTLSAVNKRIENPFKAINKAKIILSDQALSSDEKVTVLRSLFSDELIHNTEELQNQLNTIFNESMRITKNEDFYDHLEEQSIKLQNRVSEIVKNLQFDQDSSNKNMIESINHYKSKDGGLGNTVPKDFLEPDERDIVLVSGKLRISLYKVLLFLKIADAIRSGALNLKYSYKYQPFDNYLISKEKWKSNKNDLLEKAGLVEIVNFSVLEVKLRKVVQNQFKVTNENIITKINEYAKVEDNGSLKIQTPKQEHESIENEIDLFPRNRFVSLFEVLSTINSLSKFTDYFEHLQVKNNRNKPNSTIFFAGIIGYGCNVGIRKIAKISKNINRNVLENTINWYFTHDNIMRANDSILELLDQLQLPRIFKKDQELTHTSSDGQKYSIAVESLNSNYSYKYFGKGKGVSIYSFIDESHRLFYSTVINPAEREAAYVIDGLMYNDVVQSDIHSTDTHGYSEVIFAITHLLGISFAPRIKNFKDQQLYSVDSPLSFKDRNYVVIPSKTININLINDYWDEILRLIATIKLKEETASQLFRRLSSYSKQHPLYAALKQFGRIVKTLFLLKYIDDVKLRQMIEKQLNKLESSNKFGKAVFHGNNQEFQQATKEEQLIADGCKRLIENVIICWNYLYLSQLLLDTKSDNEKQNLIQTIKSGSVVTWHHINLQGEYDFSEEILKNSIEFKLPELLDVRVD